MGININIDVDLESSRPTILKYVLDHQVRDLNLNQVLLDCGDALDDSDENEILIKPYWYKIMDPPRQFVYYLTFEFQIISPTRVTLINLDHHKTEIEIIYPTELSKDQIPVKYHNLNHYWMIYYVKEDKFLLEIRGEFISDHFLVSNHDDLVLDQIVNLLNQNLDQIRIELNQGHGLDLWIGKTLILHTYYDRDYPVNEYLCTFYLT